MRITYLHQYFNIPQMSGGTRSYEMARRLVMAGHQVTMITSDPMSNHAGDNWRVSDEAGIQVHWLSVPYSNQMSYPERIRAFFCFACKSAFRAASLPADVVFATSTPLTIVIPGIISRLWHRIPMVFEVRDLWPELPIAVGALRSPFTKELARLLEWLAYHASKHVIALSPGMAEGIIGRGIRDTRVTVIPNSSDVELFDVPPERGNSIRARLGLSPGQPLIVYAGTLGFINGVGYLVELAFVMRTQAPEVRFLIVGGGAELQKITQQAKELGVLNRNLWIWDAIPKAEMPDLLAAATVATSVVIPLRPLWNNSANKFFDALAAGKPIAINYGGWQADLLHETGAGIILPPDDLNQAARLLADFLHNEDSLQKASIASRELAYKEFARDILATKLEHVLQRAVEQTKTA